MNDDDKELDGTDHEGVEGELVRENDPANAGPLPTPTPPPSLDAPIDPNLMHRNELDIEFINKLSMARFLMIEELIERIKAKELTVDQLLVALARIQDFSLTEKWTKKLEKAILANPSLLTSPGSKAGGMLEKLRTFGTRTKSAQKRDGRGSGEKLRRDTFGGDELPLDEAV